MSRFIQLLITGLVAVAASTVASADDCELSGQREARLDATGAQRAQIDARAGSLLIEGVTGTAELEASGQACASEQEYLDAVRLESRREGDVLHLAVIMPDTDRIGFGNYPRLDLRVTVPDSLPVTAVDSSGDAELRNLAALDMTDSSGDLRIDDVPGDVTVQDSSGELRIRNVGSVRLSDSSGEVEITGVERDVEIEVDSSGELEINRVKGSVRIEQDSSGDITVADVDGDVRIERDSSGGVFVRRVGGAFDLGVKSSGDVRVADVQGDVNVPDR